LLAQHTLPILHHVCMCSKAAKALAWQLRHERREQGLHAGSGIVRHACVVCCRWRARALAMQECPSPASDGPASPKSPSSPTAAVCFSPAAAHASSISSLASSTQEASAGSDLACELSFAAFATQQQRSRRSRCSSTGGSGAPADGQRASRRASDSSDEGSEAAAAAGGAEDQVLFDDELASYISDTDYAEMAEEGLEVSMTSSSCSVRAHFVALISGI
jgi:hypothetical protein